MVEEEARDEVLFPERVGDRLRAARIKAGIDLSDIATRTRVPLRHLEAIEQGDYSGMPSPTYAIGFAKSYARAIGDNSEDVARALRFEIGQRQPEERGSVVDLDDTDPARVPGRTLAWTATGIALAIAIAYGVWRGWMMQTPDTPEKEVVVAEAPKSETVGNATAPVAPNPAGQVVLTARDTVWLRIYDASNKRIFEKEMAAGESYTVPADANNPMIRTGRAELIVVAVDGKEVAPLGPPERTVKDVGVSAAALAARPPATPVSSESGATASNATAPATNAPGQP